MWRDATLACAGTPDSGELTKAARVLVYEAAMRVGCVRV